MPATRADNACELCSATDDLATFPVGPEAGAGGERAARRPPA